MTDLSKLSDSQLDDLEKQARAQKSLDSLSNEDLDKLEAQVKEASKPPSIAKSVLVGAQEGATLGFRPVIGAASESVGTAIGTFGGLKNAGMPFLDRAGAALKAGADAYGPAKRELVTEGKEAQAANPKSFFAGNVLAGVAQAPLVTVKGAMGAAKLGALAGAGRAASEAESIPEAVGNVALGAATGGLLGRATGNAFAFGRGAFRGFTGKAGGAASQAVTRAGTEAVEGATERLSPLQVVDMGNEGGARPDAKLVQEAAERLGFKPTAGMLSTNPVVRGAESSLEQSPSIGGMLVRKDVAPVRAGTQKAAASVLEGGSSFDANEVGDAVKASLKESVQGRLKPVAGKFQELKSYTKDIPLSPKATAAVSRQILANPKVTISQNSPAASVARQYADDITRLQNIDQAKQLRTIVGRELQTAEAAQDINKASVLNDVYKSLSRLEENWLKKGVQAASRTKPEGNKIAKQMIGDLKGAKKGYADLMGVIGRTEQNAGLGKASRSPEYFLEKLDSIPNEKLVKDLFKTNNAKALGTLKKDFPQVFEMVRDLKLSQIMKASEIKGQISAPKLLKEIAGISNEARGLLFKSKDAARVVKDLEIVLNSMPDRMGPSGSPQGMSFNAMADLGFQAKDMVRYGQYRSLANPQGGISPKAFGRMETAAKITRAPLKGLEAVLEGKFSPVKNVGLQYLNRSEPNPAIKRRLATEGKK